MKKMTSNEIRRTWYDFFEKKGHISLPSFPLINQKDESLLFVNAGVTPLKKYFDGTEVFENNKLVTIQKCVRTNDIEEVGITRRHLTFFEMMGNFSIGDYFKQLAIEMAYELLFDVFNFDKNLIYVTVYIDDKEAYEKWLSLGIEKSHIIKLEGNFWEIGEGPCGPDSEIFFDRGQKYGPDSDFEKFKNDEDQDRFIEIWNIVFSEFNSLDGVERKDYPELPHKNIDTGAGLERWCVVLQGVDSVFETDLFQPIIEEVEKISGKKYNGQKEFKIIADHLRTITVLLHEGIGFGNSGRSYILRRLLRRSLRMGKNLEIEGAFLYKLLDVVVKVLEDNYPELRNTLGVSKALVLEEEKLFLKTLNIGEAKLLEKIEEAKKLKKDFSGYDAFKLYDTYGFPFELTQEYLKEARLTVSFNEYFKYMQIAKDRSRSNVKKVSMNFQNEELVDFKEESIFDYDVFELKARPIFSFEEEDFLYLIFDKTCFYAESGGQASDNGFIKGENFLGKVLQVDVAPNGQHLHKVQVLEGKITDQEYQLEINVNRRKKLRVNHSATHIIHHALRTYFKLPIKQAGSFIEEDYFRFDFTYTGNIMDHDILNIEKLSNDFLKGEVKIETMEKNAALKTGAIADFNNAYGEEVRVAFIGDSIEFCGGTHVESIDEIKKIAILSLASIGSNTYRLIAATNDAIEVQIEDELKPLFKEEKTLLIKLNNLINKAQEEEINLNVELDLDETDAVSFEKILNLKNELLYLKQETKRYDKIYRDLLLKKYSKKIDELLNDVESFDINFLYINDLNIDSKIVKEFLDNISNKLDNAFIVIVQRKKNGINISIKSTSKINAGLFMKNLASLIGGSGGGSATFASGGTTLEDTKYIKERVLKLMEKYR